MNIQPDNIIIRNIRDNENGEVVFDMYVQANDRVLGQQALLTAVQVSLANVHTQTHAVNNSPSQTECM